MKKFDAVVFDMDGVIFDSERATMDCWLELAKKYGIEDLEKPFLACTGTNNAKTKEIMLDAYGQDFPYDKFAKEASVMFHEKYDGGKLPMKSGVVEILEFLKGSNKKIALASSTRKQTVLNELRDDIIACFKLTLAHTVNTSGKNNISSGKNLCAFNNTVYYNISGSFYFKVSCYVAVNLHITGKINIAC